MYCYVLYVIYTYSTPSLSLLTHFICGHFNLRFWRVLDLSWACALLRLVQSRGIVSVFYGLLAVHLITVFVNNQLDAQFFSLYLCIPILYKCSSSGESIVSKRPLVYVTLCRCSTWLLETCREFSTCFEQPSVHHRDSQLYQYDLW